MILKKIMEQNSWILVWKLQIYVMLIAQNYRYQKKKKNVLDFNNYKKIIDQYFRSR